MENEKETTGILQGQYCSNDILRYHLSSKKNFWFHESKERRIPIQIQRTQWLQRTLCKTAVIQIQSFIASYKASQGKDHLERV